MKGLVIAILFFVTTNAFVDRSYYLENVVFDLNSAEITDAHKKQLKVMIATISTMLEESDKTRFSLWINGNADPTERNARQLSLTRATHVKRYLAELNLNNGTLLTKGYGFKRPLTKSANTAEQKRNARVDFQIRLD